MKVAAEVEARYVSDVINAKMHLAMVDINPKLRLRDGPRLSVNSSDFQYPEQNLIDFNNPIVGFTYCKTDN